MENPESPSHVENSSHEEEDPWMEDIILTELERNKLMELETSYLTSYLITKHDFYSNFSTPDADQPPGTISQKGPQETCSRNNMDNQPVPDQNKPKSSSPSSQQPLEPDPEATCASCQPPVWTDSSSRVGLVTSQAMLTAWAAALQYCVSVSQISPPSPAPFIK